jgi:hypothetical protein
MKTETNINHSDAVAIAINKKQAAMDDIALITKNLKILALGESIVHRGQALSGEVDQAALIFVECDDMETAKYVHEVASTLRLLSQKVLPAINCRLARMVINEAEEHGYKADSGDR